MIKRGPLKHDALISNAFPVGSRIQSLQPNAPIIDTAMEGPEFGSLSEGVSVHFFVPAYTGPNSHGMNRHLVLGEKLHGALRIAGQEHSMSLASKDRLRQAKDAQVVSHHENGVLHAIVALSLHFANHLFSNAAGGLRTYGFNLA